MVNANKRASAIMLELSGHVELLNLDDRRGSSSRWNTPAADVGWGDCVGDSRIFHHDILPQNDLFVK